MVKVKLGDKEVSIDGYLKQKLDNIKIILKKNWDALIIIDGKERSGKSTLGITVATYLHSGFNQSNIAVDSEDAVRKLENLPNRSILMLDEGSMIFSSKDAMSKAQKKIIKILNVIGQKNMVFIIVLPSFFDLNKWIATDRARFLLHSYTDSNLTRGRFSYFGTNKLKKLYEYGRKNYGSYKSPEADFYGRFGDFKPEWYGEYLKVKQATLIAVLRGEEKETGRHTLQRNALFKYIFDNGWANQSEISEYLKEFDIGLAQNTISDSIKMINGVQKKAIGYRLS